MEEGFGCSAKVKGLLEHSFWSGYSYTQDCARDALTALVIGVFDSPSLSSEADQTEGSEVKRGEYGLPLGHVGNMGFLRECYVFSYKIILIS